MEGGHSTEDSLVVIDTLTLSPLLSPSPSPPQPSRLRMSSLQTPTLVERPSSTCISSSSVLTAVGSPWASQSVRPGCDRERSLDYGEGSIGTIPNNEPYESGDVVKGREYENKFALRIQTWTKQAVLHSLRKLYGQMDMVFKDGQEEGRTEKVSAPQGGTRCDVQGGGCGAR